MQSLISLLKSMMISYGRLLGFLEKKWWRMYEGEVLLLVEESLNIEAFQAIMEGGKHGLAHLMAERM
jgi:hypothetical protein